MISSLPPMCGPTHENVMHALLLCDYAHLVWHESNIPIPLPSVVGNTFCMWFSAIMSCLSKEMLELAMAVQQQIQKARNAAVWEAALPHPRRVWLRLQGRLTHGANSRPRSSHITAAAATWSGCFLPRSRGVTASQVLLGRKLHFSDKKGDIWGCSPLTRWIFCGGYEWSPDELFLSAHG